MVDAVEQVPETTSEVNFDDAFARLANLEQPALGEEPPKKPEEAPAADAKPAAEAPAADDKPAEPDKPAEAAPAAPAAAPVEAPKEPAPSDAVLERLEKLLKPAEAAPAAPAATPEQPAPMYSDDEASFLNNYVKEWPDVHRAEALIRRGEHQQLLSFVFNELAKEIRPLMETVQVLSQRTFLGDLTTKVADYDQVRDQVIDWVDTQPAYLQDAYKRVIENGSVEEIADLIGRYKREVGVPATQVAQAPAPKKPDTELPPATKQAAAALAPVSSKRTVVPQAVDPTDFEAAFASFASKM